MNKMKDTWDKERLQSVVSNPMME